MAAKSQKSNDEKNVHKGHRLRVKQRFLREGLENFEPHQILELLLFYGIPMKDTNEIAHRLLETFGSIYKVMEASYEDLRRVPGMTDHAAFLIAFSCQLVKRYWTERCALGTVVYSSRDIGDYIKYHFIGEKVESVYLICMDCRAKILNCTRIAEGDINSAKIDYRKVLEIILRDNATQIALVHNHPTGHAFPSKADISFTFDLLRRLQIIEVHILDHIIVSENDFISMAETPDYATLFNVRYLSEEMRREKQKKFEKAGEDI